MRWTLSLCPQCSPRSAHAIATATEANDARSHNQHGRLRGRAAALAAAAVWTEVWEVEWEQEVQAMVCRTGTIHHASNPGLTET